MPLKRAERVHIWGLLQPRSVRLAAVGHLCLYVLKAHLSERPGELHVLSSAVAALQKPGFAVHVNQTLVVIVVDRRAQHSQVKLLGAGVVHVLLGNRGVQ